MKKLSLTLEEIFNDNFELIAIYSDEEDYRLAFLLNQYLELRLQKTDPIITTHNNEFTVFEYDDRHHYRLWQLIFNHHIRNRKVNRTHDLFSDSTITFDKTTFFIKKLKKARFLLKLEAEQSEAYYRNIVNKISNIPQVYACDIISLDRINDKEFKKLLF